MIDGILHQWLYGDTWQFIVQDRIIDIKCILDLILHPDIHNINIIFQMNHLLGHLVTSVYLGNASHSIQRIIKKMWIDLCL